MELNNSKTIGLILGVMAIAAVAAWGIYTVLQPKQVAVMQQANPSQIALAGQELSAAAIAYSLNEDGSQILVNSVDALAARTLLADLGLPFDHSSGLELFANSEFGVTEFAQQINYKRALEGELVRTISSLKEVRYARVHLVLPEKSLLNAKGQDASAAVTVFLREGAWLSDEQVQGIRQMISASVPKLAADAVAILDQNGVSLDAPGLEGSLDYSRGYRMQQEMEQALTLRIYDLLRPQFGMDALVVQVNAELNLDQITRRRQELITDDQGKGYLLSRQTRNTVTEAKKGTGSNDEELSFGYGSLVEDIQVKPGTIKRLSVAVSVQADSLSAQQQLSIEQLIRHALGMSSQRGDQVFVHGFNQPAVHNGVSDPSPRALLQEPESQVSLQPAPLAGIDPAASMPVLPEAASPESASWLARVNLWQPLPLWVVWLLCAVVVVLIGLLAMAWRALRQRERAQQLSEAQRDAALAAIRNWLHP